MRKLLLATAITAATAALALPALAAPTLSLNVYQDGVQQGSTVSSNTGALNQLVSTSLFSFISVVSVGSPILTQPELTVQHTSISSTQNFSGTHTLRIEVSQTDVDSGSARISGNLAQLVSSFTQNFLIGGGVSSVVSTNYVSQDNVAFGRGVQLSQLSSTSAGGPTNDSGLMVSPTFTLTGSLFSETAVIEATFVRAGATLNASSQIVGVPPTAVPEPASLALFGAGLLGLGMVRRRRG